VKLILELIIFFNSVIIFAYNLKLITLFSFNYYIIIGGKKYIIKNICLNHNYLKERR
jgi:hypothetical protein